MIRIEDRVMVCRHCKSSDFGNIDHGLWFQDGSSEDGVQVCVWVKCRHEAVGSQRWCHFCEPPDPTEAPF
jgi:hypothetical protein